MSSEAITGFDQRTSSSIEEDMELLDSDLTVSYDPDKRRRRQHCASCLAPALSVAALLIALATVAMVMAFVGVVGPKFNQLQSSPYSADALTALKSDGTGSMTPNFQILSPQDSQPLDSIKSSFGAPVDRGASSIAAAETQETTTLSAAATSLKSPRQFECWSDTFDDSRTLLYPSRNNVTRWRKSQLIDTPCPAVSDRSAELFIEEDGHYFLYSQTWLSGGMNKGVVLQKVHNENGSDRSLKIKHNIVCWQNCDGRRDGNGAVQLCEAEITALDTLNTFVAVQVRLRRHATLGVMVTSPNVTGGSIGTWQKAVLGVVRLS